MTKIFSPLLQIVLFSSFCGLFNLVTFHGDVQNAPKVVNSNSTLLTSTRLKPYLLLSKYTL